jgi:hypothetical protein
MATDRSGLFAAVALGAVGLGLLALPWLQRSRPNPLPDSFHANVADADLLRDVLVRYDAACKNGDLAAFAACVTAARRQSLAAQAEKLGRVFDGVALREYAALDGGLAARFDSAFLAGQAFASRALVAVRLHIRQGDLDPGVQLLSFQWNGAQFQLDDILFDPMLAPDDAPHISAWMGRTLHSEDGG